MPLLSLFHRGGQSLHRIYPIQSNHVPGISLIFRLKQVIEFLKEKIPPVPYYRSVLALNVSADMLLFDNIHGPNEDLRFHFEAVSKLAPKEKNVIKELIEGMSLKHDAKHWPQVSGVL